MQKGVISDVPSRPSPDGVAMALVDAVAELAGADRHEDIVAIVLGAARRIAGADAATFCSRDGEVCRCRSAGAARPAADLPLDGSIPGWCILNGAPAVVADVRRDPRAACGTLPLDGVSSLVCVPVEDDPPAALGVYWRRQCDPSHATVATLQALARCAGAALGRLRHRQGMRGRLDEVSALYRLTDRLYRAEALADTYEAAIEAILAALRCERASVLLFDAGGVMRFVASRGLSEHYRRTLEGHSPWRPGDRDPEPIFVTDIAETDESQAVKATITAEGIRALAFIPLVSRGLVIGKFMAYHARPHVFTDHEMQLAVTIARQLGFSLERARAEEARLAADADLRRNEERLRLATLAGKVGLWDWDIGAGRIAWTDSLYPIHGVDEQSFDGTLDGYARLIHPDDRARVDQAVMRALEKDAPYEIEFRIVRPDGQVVWVFTNAVVVRDGRKPVRMVGATVDVSERKRAEAALRESESRFRTMSESAPVMIWMSGPQGECLHLNRMLRAFWGVSDASVAGFDWRPTMHPDDADRIGRILQDALRARSAVVLKGRYRRADGEYRVLETQAQPRFSETGEFLGMIGVNIDITEREQAEASLRESEERFRLAVEAAPSGMVLTDGAGRIVLVNAQAETLLGYRRDELVGHTIEMLVPERFRGRHPVLRDAYGAHPVARPMGAGRDLFARRRDGSEFPVEIGLSPFAMPEGPMVLCSVVDIGERKRAEEQREMLLRELNHRVKNTLAVVQGIAHQTFRNEGAAAAEAFKGRLVALATAHNLLTQTNWGVTDLHTLAGDSLKASPADPSRITVGGPPVVLEPKATLAIALTLHELATNAVKYGALSDGAGTVGLCWEVSEGPARRLRLEWRESGGPPVRPPERRGFGSQLIERLLASDLEGEATLEFRPDGLVYRADAPLPCPGGAA